MQSIQKHSFCIFDIKIDTKSWFFKISVKWDFEKIHLIIRSSAEMFLFGVLLIARLLLENTQIEHKNIE
jgi:hypothetical protein